MSKRLIILLIAIMPLQALAKDSFFNQRYRGWIWFEEKENKEIKDKQEQAYRAKSQKQEEYKKARAEVEEFAKELEDLRYMMIRYPGNVDHARAFLKKQGQMMDNAITLAATGRMVNFMHPNDFNQIENPQNLYGRRIKQEQDKLSNEEKIKQLASKVELFMFFAKDCPYSSSLAPVLDNFTKRYGFKCEAVSIDGSKSPYFKTHHNKELVEHLKLEQTPTVIAVTRDSKISFELIRGASSMTELEEYSLLGLQYLKQMTVRK